MNDYLLKKNYYVLSGTKIVLLERTVCVCARACVACVSRTSVRSSTFQLKSQECTTVSVVFAVCNMFTYMIVNMCLCTWL